MLPYENIFTGVCEPKLYAKYKFLECYQRNITNHSDVRLSKLRVYYMQNNYFYKHITLMIFYIALHCSLSVLKTNCEIIKCSSFLKDKKDLLPSRN